MLCDIPKLNVSIVAIKPILSKYRDFILLLFVKRRAPEESALLAHQVVDFLFTGLVSVVMFETKPFKVNALLMTSCSDGNSG